MDYLNSLENDIRQAFKIKSDNKVIYYSTKFMMFENHIQYLDLIKQEEADYLVANKELKEQKYYEVFDKALLADVDNPSYNSFSLYLHYTVCLKIDSIDSLLLRNELSNEAIKLSQAYLDKDLELTYELQNLKEKIDNYNHRAGIYIEILQYCLSCLENLEEA